MNFLNDDFDKSRSPTETKSTSVQELRDYYLSTLRDPAPSLHPPGCEPQNDHDPINNDREGKAGPLGTLLWNTLVLSERSMKNYSRNLLAYGVRIGMYAGEYPLAFLYQRF